MLAASAASIEVSVIARQDDRVCNKNRNNIKKSNMLNLF